MAGVKIGVAAVAVGVIVGIAAQLSAIGLMHAAIVDRARDAVARATGLTMTGYYIGALVSPFLFGVVADATDTFAWSWLGTASLLCSGYPDVGDRQPNSDTERQTSRLWPPDRTAGGVARWNCHV